MNLYLKEAFTATQLTNWFGVPRTTLFRWEDGGLIGVTGRIGAAGRGGEGERVYNLKHLRQVGDQAQDRFFRSRSIRILQRTKYGDDCPLWTTEELREHALLRLYSDPSSPNLAKQYLVEAVRDHALPQSSVAHLADFALAFPVGHPVRPVIWKALALNEEVLSRLQ